MRVLFLTSMLSINLFVSSPVLGNEKPEQTVLQSDGFVVEALDGTFKLEPGKPASTPNAKVRICWTDYSGPSWAERVYRGPLSHNIEDGIKHGAIPVRVLHEESNRSLRGRMLFCKVHSSVEAYGLDEYNIYIPMKAFDAAYEGDVAAVYAKTFGPLANAYVWILWLSQD